MGTRRALAVPLALLSCIPSVLLAIATGMMKISHGDVWGKHNRSFLLLFLVVFALLFIPTAVKCKAERRMSFKRLLRMELTHLPLGAGLGYLASLLAYAGLIVAAGVSGAPELQNRSDALYVAAVLLLNNYGWLFGLISFFVFDLVWELYDQPPSNR